MERRASRFLEALTVALIMVAGAAAGHFMRVGGILWPAALLLMTLMTLLTAGLATGHIRYVKGSEVTPRQKQRGGEALVLFISAWLAALIVGFLTG